MDNIGFALVLRNPDFEIPLRINWDGPDPKDSEYYMDMRNRADFFYNVISDGTYISFEKVICRFTTSNGRNYVIRFAIRIPANRVIKNENGIIIGPKFVLDQLAERILQDLFDRLGEAYRLKPRPDYAAEEQPVREILSQFRLDRRWGTPMTMAQGDSKPAMVNAPEGDISLILKDIPRNTEFIQYSSVAVGEFRDAVNTISAAKAMVPREANVIVTDVSGNRRKVVLTEDNSLFSSIKCGYEAQYFEPAEISFNLADALKWADGKESLPAYSNIRLELNYPEAAVCITFAPNPKQRSFKVKVEDDLGDRLRTNHAYTIVQWVDAGTNSWEPIPPSFVVSGRAIGDFINSAKQDSFKSAFRTTETAYAISSVNFDEYTGDVLIKVHYTEPPKPVVLNSEADSPYKVYDVQVVLADGELWHKDAKVTVSQFDINTHNKHIAEYDVEWEEQKEEPEEKSSTAKGTPILPQGNKDNNDERNKRKSDKKGSKPESKSESELISPEHTLAAQPKKGIIRNVIFVSGVSDAEAEYGSPAISHGALVKDNTGYYVTFKPESQDVNFIKAVFRPAPNEGAGVRITRWCLIALLFILLIAGTAVVTYVSHDRIEETINKWTASGDKEEKPEIEDISSAGAAEQADASVPDDSAVSAGTAEEQSDSTELKQKSEAAATAETDAANTGAATVARPDTSKTAGSCNSDNAQHNHQ